MLSFWPAGQLAGSPAGLLLTSVPRSHDIVPAWVDDPTVTADQISLLALVNSFGVVEIARAERSAAEALGLGRGAPVIVSDH
jgi:hypothetical protein